MRPIGAAAGSARPASALKGALAAFALAGLALLAGPVAAGDRALLDILGYSEDGAYFAFEEFGIQDGSGFAYSNIYVLELATDSWVPGTPVRFRPGVETEDVPLPVVRARALDMAMPVLDRLGIVWPADILALIGDGVADGDARRLDFGLPSYQRGEILRPHTLRLDTAPAPADPDCASWFEGPFLGFSLTLETKGASHQVHSDESVPRSRGCPFDYRLYGVVAPFWAGDLDAAVALVSVYPGGFEGPDRRFIAVPLGR